MTSFLRIASIALCLGSATVGLGGCATAGPDPYGVAALYTTPVIYLAMEGLGRRLGRRRAPAVAAT